VIGRGARAARGPGSAVCAESTAGGLDLVPFVWRPRPFRGCRPCFAATRTWPPRTSSRKVQAGIAEHRHTIGNPYMMGCLIHDLVRKRIRPRGAGALACSPTGEAECTANSACCPRASTPPGSRKA